ncbi:protein of unknown function [Paraburkholderia kururiensis]
MPCRPSVVVELPVELRLARRSKRSPYDPYQFVHVNVLEFWVPKSALCAGSDSPSRFCLARRPAAFPVPAFCDSRRR